MIMKLRELNDSDIPQVKKWLTLPDVARWFEHPDSWVMEMERRDSEYNFIRHFILTLDGKDIGFCQYYEYQKGGESWHGNVALSGTYSIDYLIGEAEYLEQGNGTEMIHTLLDAVWTEPDAKRIIAQPDIDNGKSRKALLSAGFRYLEDDDLLILEKRQMT